MHVHECALHEHVPREPPFGRTRVHLLPVPRALGARARSRRAPERELVRPGAAPEHEREQLQRLSGPAVLGVPGDHGRPGHHAPVRHPVEHPAGGRDVAEVGVEDDELGAEVEVRRQVGGREHDPVVHGLALPEGVGADAALEQGGEERGGGFWAIDKGHCGARYVTPPRVYRILPIRGRARRWKQGRGGVVGKGCRSSEVDDGAGGGFRILKSSTLVESIRGILKC